MSGIYKVLPVTLVCFLMLSGCSPQALEFEPNQLIQFRMERELRTDLNRVSLQASEVLVDAFGTPDNPRWPKVLVESPAYVDLVDQESLLRAAGPVGRGLDLVEIGLFRKQCAQCHGISGDGRGPTAALLDPYPRDFRRGTFKYKSTPYGTRPTIEDLTQTIAMGIPGTSMPAMVNLKRSKHYSDDIPILAKYVRYLAIRGEVERELMMNAIRDLEEDESLFDRSLEASNPVVFAANQKRIDEAIVSVADRWLKPAESPFEQFATNNRFAAEDLRSEMLSMKKEDFNASIARGKEIFEGSAAACFQCHGRDGVGDSKWKDFDEWTKDWTIRAGIDPAKKSEWAPLKKLGLLKPVKASPRNLLLGVFRGKPITESFSNSDIDSNEGGSTVSPRKSILRAVLNGIEGSPMPPAPLARSTVGGLDDNQVIDLVRYVESLSIKNLPASASPEPSSGIGVLEPSDSSHENASKNSLKSSLKSKVSISDRSHSEDPRS